ISYKTDGIRYDNVQGQSTLPRSYPLQRCVIGPGLRNGIVLNQDNTLINANFCLFINPSVSNIVATGQNDAVRFWKSVSFLTPRSINGTAHDCLTLTANQYNSINYSVFYGGAVHVQGTTVIGQGVEQFATTGNTSVLSPTMVNPQFSKTNVALVP